MPADPEKAQGTCPPHTFVRGNNIKSRDLTYLLNGLPVNITAARFAARDKVTRNILIKPTNCVFLENVVTRPIITKDQTSKFPDSVSWDIEIEIDGADERTWIRGDFLVKPTDQ